MRIITRSENQNMQRENHELLKSLKNVYKKLHKSTRHLDFLEKCISHRVIPKFVSLPESASKHMSKEETFTIEKRKVEAEIKNQKNRISFLENQYDNEILTFKLTFKINYEYENALKDLKNSVHRSERFSDEKRDKKLKQLINLRFTEFSTVEIYNLSSTDIPDDVKSILNLGRNLAIGDSARGSNILWQKKTYLILFKITGAKMKLMKKFWKKFTPTQS